MDKSIVVQQVVSTLRLSIITSNTKVPVLKRKIQHEYLVSGCLYNNYHNHNWMHHILDHTRV